MGWVVDSCVILDIALGDPSFGQRAAECVASLLPDGVAACPVSEIEVVPQFGGELAKVRLFLRQAGIQYSVAWQDADTIAAAAGWTKYVTAKRMAATARRPIADIQIGGFAMRFQGLITRNPGDFRPWFPNLKIVEP